MERGKWQVRERVVRWVLIVLGVITATPAFALVWPAQTLDFSYRLGVPDDPMVLALLQHRGMLQAVLGAAVVWAAFRPELRVPAAVTAIVTKSTFIVLIATMDGGSALDAVAGALFDVVAIVALTLVAVLHLRAGRPRTGAGVEMAATG